MGTTHGRSIGQRGSTILSPREALRMFPRLNGRGNEDNRDILGEEAMNGMLGSPTRLRCLVLLGAAILVGCGQDEPNTPIQSAAFEYVRLTTDPACIDEWQVFSPELQSEIFALIPDEAPVSFSGGHFKVALKAGSTSSRGIGRLLSSVGLGGTDLSPTAESTLEFFRVPSGRLIRAEQGPPEPLGLGLPGGPGVASPDEDTTWSCLKACAGSPDIDACIRRCDDKKIEDGS